MPSCQISHTPQSNYYLSNILFRDKGDGDNSKKSKNPDDGTLRWVVKKGLRRFTVSMIETYFDLDHAKVLGLVLLLRRDEVIPELDSDELRSVYEEMVKEI